MSDLYMSYKVMESNEGQATMTSLEVVDLINKFRKEEGNEIKKEHKTFMRDIRNEIEYLKKADIKAENNFVPGSYIDKNNQERPCYKMNKAGIMQMLNKESALVRYKTQQYIEALENKLRQPVKPLSTMEILKLQYQALEEQDQKIEEVKEDLQEFKDNAPLFQVECKELQSEVRKVGTKVLGGYKSPAYKDNSLRGKVYSDIQKQLKREFQVERYEAIKRCELDRAKEVVSNYKVPYKLGQDIELKNMQLNLINKVGDAYEEKK